VFCFFSSRFFHSLATAQQQRSTASKTRSSVWWNGVHRRVAPSPSWPIPISFPLASSLSLFGCASACVYVCVCVGHNLLMLLLLLSSLQSNLHKVNPRFLIFFFLFLCISTTISSAILVITYTTSICNLINTWQLFLSFL